jgi:hypothetical protein
MEGEIRTDAVCSFCRLPSINYIWGRAKGAEEPTIICDDCIAREHYGNIAAAQTWINDFSAVRQHWLQLGGN